MSSMIDTTEMYLRTVFELEEEGVVPMRARIAERLGQSGPTVSQTVARMERDGLLTLTGERVLELTDKGRLLATRVMRRHRLAERLLVDVLDLDWTYAHEEACRWEHVLSERVERRILALVDDPRESPYGNPIPGLGELGGAPPQAPFREGVVSLTALREPGEYLVRRISEPAQYHPEWLALLRAAGLVPGQRARISFSDRAIGASPIGAAGADNTVDIPADLAAHVFVVDARDVRPHP